jgi:hypothetical protein
MVAWGGKSPKQIENNLCGYWTLKEMEPTSLLLKSAKCGRGSNQVTSPGIYNLARHQGQGHSDQSDGPCVPFDVM